MVPISKALVDNSDAFVLGSLCVGALSRQLPKDGNIATDVPCRRCSCQSLEVNAFSFFIVVIVFVVAKVHTIF